MKLCKDCKWCKREPWWNGFFKNRVYECWNPKTRDWSEDPVTGRGVWTPEFPFRCSQQRSDYRKGPMDSHLCGYGGRLWEGEKTASRFNSGRI